MATLNTFTEDDAKKTPEEIFGNIAIDELVILKDLPYDDKIRFIRYCMGYTDLINSSLLVNIAFMVYGSKISEDVFSDTKIAFTNLEEYVDAKYDLKPEIKKYGEDLLKFYLASLKSYDVILPDNKIPIPASYKAILLTSTPRDIAKLMRTYTLDLSTLPLVIGAEEIVDRQSINGSPVVQDFINFFMENLKK